MRVGVGVGVHPCSVNHGVISSLESPWLVYGEMVESSAVYLRDCSMVTPYPLLMFGGPISVQLVGTGGAAPAGTGTGGAANAAGVVTMDGWIRLGCAPKVAVLFKELRGQLDALLQDKIERPEMDLWERGGPVINTILQLLTTETVAPAAPAAVAAASAGGGEAVPGVQQLCTRPSSRGLF
eukprot:XP_001703477.1 predicted protein [Chlamydomonas reinhardtii]